MKKFTFSLIAAAVMTSQSGLVQAQEDTKFDFTSASNYCVIFLDEESAAGIQDKILLDLTTPTIDIWPAGESIEFNEAIGKNSQGVGGGAYIDLTVLKWAANWSGGGFNTGLKNLTPIKDNFRFHMAVRSENTESLSFVVTGAKEGDEEFAANIVLGQEPFDGIKAFDDFPRDGDWHIVELSVPELKYLGWKAGIIDYAPFSFVLGGTPGVNVALDAIFYYEPAGTDGIDGNFVNDMDVLVGANTITVLGTENGIELYDISGNLIKSTRETVVGTEGIAKGIYLVKSGSVVKKVYIK